MKNTKVAEAPSAGNLASEQLGLNTKAATNQQQLNMVDQITPQGSLKYTQSGTWPDGTPKFTSEQSYSPQEQKLFDLGNETQQNLGQVGVNQSKRIGDVLNTPYSAQSGADSQYAKLSKGFLDPQWDRSAEKLRTQLISSGVRPGTEAYTRAMGDFSDNRQKGYDRSYLDSFDKANQMALTERNQPINELSALLSSSQVSQPNYGQTPTAGVAPTDLIGATQMGLNQQNLQTQMNQQSNMGLMSGAFGLGGIGLRGAMGGWGK